MKTKFSLNLGLLGFVFIALKVFGVVSWPWIWVLAPFWIGLFLAAVVFGLAALFGAIALIALKTGHATISKRTKP